MTPAEIRKFFENDYKIFPETKTQTVFLWTCGQKVVDEMVENYPGYKVILVERSFFDDIPYQLQKRSQALIPTQSDEDSGILGVSPDCDID